MRKVKLQVTPLTDETFKRQGWSKHISNDYKAPVILWKIGRI